MANNRLRLRCIVCGGVSPWIAKVMGGSEWYVQPWCETDLSDRLNAFFDEHGFCSIKSPGNPLAVASIYQTDYEQTPEVQSEPVS